MTKKKRVELCVHCGGDTSIRNPMGNCDHLHYPESCSVCMRINHEIHKIREQCEEEIKFKNEWLKNKQDIIEGLEQSFDDLIIRIEKMKGVCDICRQPDCEYLKEHLGLIDKNDVLVEIRKVRK